MNNDLISREILLNEFDTKCQCVCPSCEYHKWNSKLKRYECELINTAPTVVQNMRFYYDHGYKQAERDLKRTQGEWISVKDKLPHKEGRCLVFTDYGDVTMDSFVDGMFVCNLGNVTHWRPLPPKPYESEEENEHRADT